MDLPAFLDFRGRIYRSGVMHFHERDLSRSQRLFYDSFSPKNDANPYNTRNFLFSAAAFHYKKFISYDEAFDWYNDPYNTLKSSNESLIKMPALSKV